MGIKLRKCCGSDVIDYNQLMSCLQHYKAPHRKITTLLKSGVLIRIKKGLYIFGDDFRQDTIHLGYLANLIYGPSYVSLEYALSYYSIIPERVETVTSMTTKRNKNFQTPLGQFSYAYLNRKRFSVGIDWCPLDKAGKHYFIASPEKALVDLVASQPDIIDVDEMWAHLTENLRIDETSLSDLNLKRLKKICDHYRKPVITLLLKTLQVNS